MTSAAPTARPTPSWEHGRARLTLINKELARGVKVRVVSTRGVQAVSVSRLTAPAADSTEGVTLAGAAVDSEGRWEPARREQVQARQGEVDLVVRAVRAAVIEI